MELNITRYCRVIKNKVINNSEEAFLSESNANFEEFIKGAYKSLGLPYPKFYKMDGLSKLAFVTSEFLTRGIVLKDKYDGKDIGVVIENSSSTLVTDSEHQKTIDDRSNYFPSPSLFVYTLPNIMIGEICIKNKIFGENALLVSKEFDIQILVNYVDSLFETGKVNCCIAGWVEFNANYYESLLFLVEKDNMSQKLFNFETIINLYQGE